jgi:hypothetical protein
MQVERSGFGTPEAVANVRDEKISRLSDSMSAMNIAWKLSSRMYRSLIFVV